MPHATFRPSKASPSTGARRGGGVPQHRSARPVSDIALAEAVALAVQAVSGVAGLSPGVVTPVATYGPGRSVAGVVIRHPTLETLAIEVHVVLSQTYCTATATAAVAGGEREPEGGGDPITKIADLVRDAVRRSTQELTSSPLVRVDVFIDDLQ